MQYFHFNALMLSAFIIFGQTNLGMAQQSKLRFESSGGQEKFQILNNKIRMNISDPRPYLDRAVFFLDYVMYARARADVQRSLAIKPTGLAYYLLAKLDVDQGSQKKTQDYLAKAYELARAEKDVDCILKICAFYSTLKMFENVIEGYECALKLQPGDPVIIAWKARAQYKTGKYDAAIAGANLALSKVPPEAQIVAFGKKAETRPAEKTYRELKWEATKTRGLSLVGKHLYEQGVPDLCFAITYHPLDTEVLKARAEAYKNLGKSKLAEQDLKAIEESTKSLFEIAPFSLK